MSVPVDSADDQVRDRARRRAVPVLVGSQVLGGVGVASGIAVGGLLAEDVAGSTALSGLAQTATVLGSAALAVPLARLAAARGRRPALATGYALGLLGAGLTVLAAVLGSFALLVGGLLLFGGATASGLQARYAATDAATPETRGRSLSVVVWATTAGAVAGPNLSGLGGRVGDALGLPPLAGPYLFSAVSFAAGALVVWLLLRPDPLVVAGGPVAPGPRPTVGATLRVVLGIPAARLGLVAVMTAHAVMVGVMVMTPVHLGHGGASLEVVGLVISVHIAGMYAASPVMGWLADRAGRVATVVLGTGLLAAALVVGGLAPAQARGWVTVSMLLLGLGWSAALVAGSTLLSESVPAEVRTSAQGTSDLVMGLAGAAAGALAGPVLAAGGYPTVAAAAGVLLVPVVLLLGRRSRT
ncbi:Predicted arabinose efflux permease, MFS family [Klenkia marina]|uniref:Predicted arabinose efflux permease, MFS family n=1 Tax=Klenkia marina TaxID=1960309 RepID=A0A1G4XEH5_9ACTN|nr:MFS transporter [Klenkia marina]SCX39589.1 Predicted arabinose efflux permease, MFS family [Klenkia marina]